MLSALADAMVKAKFMRFKRNTTSDRSGWPHSSSKALAIIDEFGYSKCQY